MNKKLISIYNYISISSNKINFYKLNFNKAIQYNIFINILEYN